MLDHQPPEEHAEKPAVEGGEQEGGLGGAQPEKKLKIRQFQPDHVIDDVLIFRQVRINNAPDFHEVPLQIGGEAGEELPAAGGLQACSPDYQPIYVQVVISYTRRKTSGVLMRKWSREARNSRV
jgi:hypothetical protein